MGRRGPQINGPNWADLETWMLNRWPDIDTNFGGFTIIGHALDSMNLKPHTTLYERWRGRLERARQRGFINLEYAEDFADLFGVHPVEIWGLAYYADTAGPDRAERT